MRSIRFRDKFRLVPDASAGLHFPCQNNLGIRGCDRNFLFAKWLSRMRVVPAIFLNDVQMYIFSRGL